MSSSSIPFLGFDPCHQLQGVVCGLKYLHHHEPPVIHGDLHVVSEFAVILCLFSSPLQDNLILDGNGDVFLTDFGRCRIKHDHGPSQASFRPSRRLRYVAPELEMGLALSYINEASDIYSLGMTICALASFDHPFPNIADAHEAASAARCGRRPAKPPETRLLDNEQTDSLWSLLEKMWSQEPDNRPSVVQVEYDLRTSVIPVLQRESIDSNVRNYPLIIIVSFKENRSVSVSRPPPVCGPGRDSINSGRRVRTPRWTAVQVS